MDFFLEVCYTYSGDVMQEKTSLFIKNIVKLIIVFVLFFYSYLLQYIPIILFKLDVHKLTMAQNVMLNFFSSILLVLILTLIYRKELSKEFKIFKKNFAENINIAFNYWFIGLIIMVVSNLLIAMFFKTGGATNEKTVQNMITSLPWLMLINAGVIAPFNEEIVFRKSIKDVVKNKFLFAFISFLVFGLAHVLGCTSWVDYLYIVPYGALGGAFALAYYDTNTVFSSMSMHMFHNFILTLFSILAM